MAYLGPPPSQKLATPTSQYFSGNGSTTAFTLNRPVNVAEDLNVFVNNVAQQPGVGKSYTATGTTLTFDAAPASGTNNVYVVYRGLAEPTTRLEHPSGQPIAATTGTFSGDLTVDTTTLKVDSTNNRVGIGTTSPSVPLTVQADSDTDFSVGSAVVNTALTLRNSTSGANNPVSLGFSTESNGEVYLSAVQNSNNTAADFKISQRNSGSRATNFELTAAGYMKIPSQPAFGMYTTANSGMAVANSDIILNAGYNGGNHVNTTTGVFTAPISGRYQFSAYAIKTNQGGLVARLRVIYNGSTVAEARMDETGNYDQACCVVILNMSANDTVKFANGDANPFYMGGTYGRCNGYLIG